MLVYAVNPCLLNSYLILILMPFSKTDNKLNTNKNSDQTKIPIQISSLGYNSIAQLLILLNEGYLIKCVTHPATTTKEYSTMIDLIKSSEGKECLITVLGEEAVALVEFVDKNIRARMQTEDKDNGDISYC
jgi:hypothetical protein